MVEIQRLKGQIRTLERGNEEDFLEMGRFLYHRFQAGEQLDEQMSTLCSKIEERIERIEKHQAQIEEIKGLWKTSGKRDGVLSVLRSEESAGYLG